MAKNLGTFTFAANFQVKAAEALDPRMVAASKADLINKANWPADGDTIYVYKGLIVDCGADGVYRLVDPAKALNADYSGWERIDAGAISFDGIFSYAGSVATYDALPANPNKGDVYNVESAFSISITLPVEGEVITKEYPAGTNVAWNGEAWDALAGSIDLSGYATKVEVSEIRTNVATNTQNITNLSTALGETNEEVAKKVDAEDGKALVDLEKIELIDTNAADIVNLKAADVTLEGKISAVESAISDSSKGLDALSTRIDGHNTRLEALESDNTTNKTNISTLQTDVAGYGTRLAAAESSITSNTTNITALTTQVGEHGTSISNLNTSVQNNATEIANAKTSINGVDQRVATIEADYLKAADIAGKLNTTVYEAKVAELAQADVDNLAAAKKYADDLKVSIDSAYAAADEATLKSATDYVDGKVSEINGAASALEARVKANEDNIATLNGSDTVDGSVAKLVKDAINAFAEEVSDNNTIDTFKELIDYAATHGSEFSTLAGTVQSNANAIATLNGTAEEAGSVAKAIKDAVDAEASVARAAEEANAVAIKAISDDYLKATDKTELSNAIAAEKSRAEGVESNLEARLAAVEGDYLKSADKTELQTAINNKVAQSDYDTKVAALEKADTDNLAAAKTYADSLLEWEEVE